MTVYDKSKFSLSEGCSFDKSKKNINLNNFLRVRVVSIIDILKKYKHINLLKIDIEGSEYKIINYIIKNIKKIDVVFCEFHKTTYLQKKKYINIINFLKKKKLYNNKVYTWI
jgi:FkbM family methyltransferase